MSGSSRGLTFFLFPSCCSIVTKNSGWDDRIKVEMKVNIRTMMNWGDRKMKTNRWITLLSVALLFALLMTSTSCAKKVSGEDLMKGILSQEVQVPECYSEEYLHAALSFSLLLFQKSLEEKNTLLSPISILSAMGMTGNGALENTRTQMEEVFGMKMEDLNNLLYLYRKSLPDKEKLKIHVANSIWFKEGGAIDVEEDFLQTNANYYDASIYRAPFDESTLKDINLWVKEKTKEMIPEILDEIPEDAVMYLINALAFEGEWKDIYSEDQIQDGIFKNSSGAEETVEMMRNEESLYLENDDTVGFMKPYADGEFVFVALLPKEENQTIGEYVNSLTGEDLYELLSTVESTSVFTMMPKFKTEYKVELSEVFKAMGIKDAFDADLANLRALGTSPIGNLYISRVLHKTFIDVNERGTKAGAVTAVEVVAESAGPMDPKIVHLDRPFAYMIVDRQSNLPLFIGTTESVNP